MVKFYDAFLAAVIGAIPCILYLDMRIGGAAAANLPAFFVSGVVLLVTFFTALASVVPVLLWTCLAKISAGRFYNAWKTPIGGVLCGLMCGAPSYVLILIFTPFDYDAAHVDIRPGLAVALAVGSAVAGLLFSFQVRRCAPQEEPAWDG